MIPESRTFAGSVERMLDVSLLALVVVSFAALAATGKLDVFSLFGVTAAILLRALFFVRNMPPRQISVAATTKLTIAYAFIYAIDFFAVSRSFISATVHLVLFVLVVKLFSVHRDRDRLYLAVISFLMLLAAAILTIDAFYLGAFITFSMIAIVAFIVMEMRRSMQNSATIATPQAQARLWRLITVTSGVLIAGILLVTPFLFFALPRVSAGRLSQFAQQNAYTTGFGDEVMLGQIGQIQQSDTVVLRAQFDRSPPADLKWHGTTLTHFDGRRWFNRHTEERTLVFRGGMDNVFSIVHPEARRFLDGTVDRDSSPRLQSGAQYVSYRANLEPIGANLFFYPSRVVSIRGTSSRDYAITSNAVLSYRDTGVYVVRSYSGLSLVETFAVVDEKGSIPDPRLYPYLQLPTMDPRIKGLAEQITVGAGSPAAKALSIETYLRTKFGYTLEMVGSNDPIPFFLFERKKGHCEYFASAMAVMLRSIGIPSRIVNGFRNGERSDITGSYLIRAKDAHSWVEAFIPGRGWVEFDPTPAGDPVPQTLWSRVGLYLDAAREFWGDWVINYDFAHQNVLAEFTTNTARGQAVSLWRSVDKKYWDLIYRLQRSLSNLRDPNLPVANSRLLMALPMIFVFGVFIFWFRLRRRARRFADGAPENLASAWLRRMLKRTARCGWAKAASQTASDWAQLIPDQEARPVVSAFVKEYENARFGGSQQSAERLPELYEHIEEVLK